MIGTRCDRGLAGGDEDAEFPRKLGELRRVLARLPEDRSGVEPRDLPVAVRVVEEGCERLAVPRLEASEAFHAVEVEAEKLRPRHAKAVEARVARDLLAVHFLASAILHQ
jgi:hypothetical protein